MEKLNVRLMAFDLDDTLLDSNTNISDKTVTTLKKCAEKGIYIVLCSGRAKAGMTKFQERIGLTQSEYGKYMATINGCSLFNLQTGKEIFSRSVETHVLLEVNHMAEEMGLYSEVYSANTIFYKKETEWTLKDVQLCKVTGQIVPEYEKFISENKFPKMLVPGEPEKLKILQEKAKEKLGDRASIFTSKPFFLEVLPPDCGKGIAVLWLAKHLGIPEEQTMAFGDAMNDENMIRLCGFGVAMKNGNEELKAMADFITYKTNDEDGVADFIEKHVL